MTDKDYLKALLETGEKMRTAQKNYFASKDKDDKRRWLIESKQLEKQFDNVVFHATVFVKQFFKINNNV